MYAEQREGGTPWNGLMTGSGAGRRMSASRSLVFCFFMGWGWDNEPGTGRSQHEIKWRGYNLWVRQTYLLVANCSTRLFHKQVRCKQGKRSQGRVQCLKCDWMNRWACDEIYRWLGMSYEPIWASPVGNISCIWTTMTASGTGRIAIGR